MYTKAHWCNRVTSIESSSFWLSLQKPLWNAQNQKPNIAGVRWCEGGGGGGGLNTLFVLVCELVRLPCHVWSHAACVGDRTRRSSISIEQWRRDESVTRGCYGQRVTRISCFLCDIRDRCISNLFASWCICLFVCYPLCTEQLELRDVWRRCV